MWAARLLLLVTGAIGGPAGVWFDTSTYDTAAHSLAGTRYIAESPPGVLTMVLTDDGTSWSMVRGVRGSDGNTITFDFSRLGGPQALGGAFKGSTIQWHDGSAWTRLVAPTHEWMAAPFPDDHVGRWYDTRHVMPGGFAGTRYIAEDPPHVLTVVGTDEDTKVWFVMTGNCSGPGMSAITLDYTPRGGPDAVLGIHKTSASLRPTAASPFIEWGGQIEWPNGFHWEQVKMPRPFWQGSHFFRAVQDRLGAVVTHGPTLALVAALVVVATAAAARAARGRTALL